MVELERFDRKSSVDPVKTTIIKITGIITTTTKNTKRNAQMAERELFSRHRFINGLKQQQQAQQMIQEKE